MMMILDQVILLIMRERIILPKKGKKSNKKRMKSKNLIKSKKNKTIGGSLSFSQSHKRD
jgi:hypothetical protein